MDLGLAGKKALVTGATRGIGRAIAETLAAEGADVAFCARNPGEVAATVEALQAQGVRAFGGTVDVADAPAYTAWIDAAARDLGGIDIFVHNVSALADGEGDETWQRTYEIDLMGGVRGCRAALPYLRRSTAGSVVLIASISAAIAEGDATQHAYGVLKAAVVGLGGQLSQTYGAERIRVNVVSPGSIDFPDGFWDSVKKNDPVTYDAVQAGIPFGRMGTPEEVGRAVAFLASPAASWINGANLRVDGGQLNHVHF
jgi:3-oxoacyl-[acyl-carrier protein] reductase